MACFPRFFWSAFIWPFLSLCPSSFYPAQIWLQFLKCLLSVGPVLERRPVLFGFLNHWGQDFSGPFTPLNAGPYVHLSLGRARLLPVPTAGLTLACSSQVWEAPHRWPVTFPHRGRWRRLPCCWWGFSTDLHFEINTEFCVNAVPGCLVLLSARSVFLWRDLGWSQNYAAAFPEPSNIVPVLVSPVNIL